MSLFRDVYNDSKDYALWYRIKTLLTPRFWYSHHKWRKQRLNRGWSDRDAWNAGDHIAQITAEMLQRLNVNGICSWPDWFKLNVQEEGKGAYEDLQTVIDDIKNYLVYSETSWAEGLTTKGFEKVKEESWVSHWYDEKTGKKITGPDLNHRINKWSKEEIRLYNRAKKAMSFFGRHFSGFWD